METLRNIYANNQCEESDRMQLKAFFNSLDESVEYSGHIIMTHERFLCVCRLLFQYNTSDFSEFDVDGVRVGYKANETSLIMWEGNYLSRTKESGFSWDLVQSLTADLIDKGKYLDEKPKLSVKAVKPNNDLHIRGFSEQDGQIFAEVTQGEKSSVVPIMRDENNIAYIKMGGKPYKLTDFQNYDLEQYELYRSPVTHDVNGYYAEDLDEGDTIRLDGELWTVKSAVTYSISLVNDNGDEKYISNSPDSKWYESLTKAGFEYIPEPQIEAPVFAEPVQKKQEDISPEPFSAGSAKTGASI